MQNIYVKRRPRTLIFAKISINVCSISILERWAGRNTRASERSDEVVNESAHEIIELKAKHVDE